MRLIGADPEDESWFRLTGHDSQVNTGIAPLTGHTDTLTSVAYSPNGNTLATGGSYGTVRV
ncbi:hypothetical protein [Streptomyces fungicidicus]|uniref:hypothetical protein n=1 Tax=Streptomyces fungicidicus TaxID=68203 RepID=UPI00368DF9A3